MEDAAWNILEYGETQILKPVFRLIHVYPGYSGTDGGHTDLFMDCKWDTIKAIFVGTTVGTHE